MSKPPTDDSFLIFCVGVNLVLGNKFRVANMLPAVILACGCGLSSFSDTQVNKAVGEDAPNVYFGKILNQCKSGKLK